MRRTTMNQKEALAVVIWVAAFLLWWFFMSILS